MEDLEKKVNSLGFSIPIFNKPKFNYIPYVKFEKIIFFSGQLPWISRNKVITGKVGNQLNIDKGKLGSVYCVLNFLSVYKNFFKKFDNIEKIIKVSGFINSKSLFSKHAEIIDAASIFLINIFGEDVGGHSRSAIGVNSLPRNSIVEMEFIIALKRNI